MFESSACAENWCAHKLDFCFVRIRLLRCLLFWILSGCVNRPLELGYIQALNWCIVWRQVDLLKLITGIVLFLAFLDGSTLAVSSMYHLSGSGEPYIGPWACNNPSKRNFPGRWYWSLDFSARIWPSLEDSCLLAERCRLAWLPMTPVFQNDQAIP